MKPPACSFCEASDIPLVGHGDIHICGNCAIKAIRIIAADYLADAEQLDSLTPSKHQRGT